MGAYQGTEFMSRFTPVTVTPWMSFTARGIACGGSDDGPPGIRAEYDRHYYAAFLRDPDGNKIEVVTFSAN